jgi:hypothetical protein
MGYRRTRNRIDEQALFEVTPLDTIHDLFNSPNMIYDDTIRPNDVHHGDGNHFVCLVFQRSSLYGRFCSDFLLLRWHTVLIFSSFIFEYANFVFVIRLWPHGSVGCTGCLPFWLLHLLMHSKGRENGQLPVDRLCAACIMALVSQMDAHGIRLMALKATG